MSHSHHETIQLLVQKATEIFSEKGYCSTNMSDITNALGISRGPVYYHFKDKVGLYEAAFDQFNQDVRRAHNEIILSNKPFSEFVEDVIFDCVQRNTLHGPNFFFGIENSSDLEQVKVKFEQMNHDIFQEKIDYVNQSKLKGEIHPDADPKLIADMIYIVFYGMLTTIQKETIKDPSEANIRSIIRQLISGIMQYCQQPKI
jgi:TetR/AcrR family transcriptional regulator, transcriptional repressor for nem operon